MALRFPYLEVTGPDGRNLVERLQKDFVGVQITDREGGESDELCIRIRASKPYRAPPPPDTAFTVKVGWERTGALVTGRYLFQRVSYVGEPESGEEMRLICRAAEAEGLKQIDSEHFDEETGHKTYGDVLKTLAERAGLGAAIDPEIAKIPLAGGYLLRWKQSAIGLATDLADELGAIVKPQAGQLTVRRRGSGRSASGEALPGVTVRHDPAYAWSADIEPRFGYGEVLSQWFDEKKGRPGDALKAIAGGAARFALPHLGGSQAYAMATTAAAAQRLKADEATGTFECLGTALAVAGAPLKASGFPPDVNSVRWEIVSAFHDIGPERGWVTTIETKKMEEE